MNRSFYFLMFLAGWALILSACSPKITTLNPKNDATLPELMDLFDRREKEQQSMKAMVSFSFQPVRGRGQDFNGLFSFEKHENFHFRGLDSFGGTLLDLILSGDQFKMTLRGEPPVRGFLAEQTGLRLRTGSEDSNDIQWTPWLKIMKEASYGGNPVLQPDETVQLEKEGDFLVYSVLSREESGGRLTKKIWLERSFFRPVKEEVYEGDLEGGFRLAWTFYFNYSPDKKNSSWPDKIKVKSEIGELGMDFLEVHFSPIFEKDTFKISE